MTSRTLLQREMERTDLSMRRPGAYRLPMAMSILAGATLASACAPSASDLSQNSAGQEGVTLGSAPVQPGAVAASVTTSTVDERDRISITNCEAYQLLDAQGQLYAWGRNTDKVLGPDFDALTLSPEPMPGLPLLKRISGGCPATAGIDMQDRLWLWGRNDNYIIQSAAAGGIANESLAPRLISGLPAVRHAAISAEAVIVLGTDGSVWGWGDSISGVWDSQTQTSATVPVKLVPSTPVTRLYAGSGDETNSSLLIWGTDAGGQVYRLSASASSATGVAFVAVADMPKVTRFSTDLYANTALGIDGSGQVWRMGSTTYCGLFASEDRTLTPTRETRLPALSWVQASFGNILALDPQGQAWGWGCNRTGALGSGNLTSASNPMRLPELDGLPWLLNSPDTAISVDAQGGLLYWGSPQYGIQADGTQGLVDALAGGKPLPVVPSVKDVSTSNVTLVLDNTGHLWGTGANYSGDLGDGTATARSSFVAILPQQTFTQVLTRDGTTVAVTPEGRVWTWGYNREGSLGDGTTTSRLTPAVLPSFAPIQKVQAMVSSGIAALDTSGKIWRWGYNFCGNSVTKPTRWTLLGADNIQDFAMTYQHLLLKNGTGELMAVGLNEDQQLGVPGNPKHCSPVKVRGVPTYTSFLAGQGVSLALDQAGQVWTWGQGFLLGREATDDQFTPGLVTGLPRILELQLVGNGIFARDLDGKWWYWGRPSTSSLGVTALTSTQTPKPLAMPADFVRVWLRGVTLARKSDGAYRIGGYNGYGALGLGDTWTPTESAFPYELGF